MSEKFICARMHLSKGQVHGTDFSLSTIPGNNSKKDHEQGPLLYPDLSLVSVENGQMLEPDHGLIVHQLANKTNAEKELLICASVFYIYKIVILKCL